MTPDQEARHIMKKIRRHVRLMNRKWVELNQHSNEWQHRLDAVLEVNLFTAVAVLSTSPSPRKKEIKVQVEGTEKIPG